MTDNEIIKALELCGTNDHCHTLNCPFGRKESWDNPCQSIAIKYALDLITHQKAEIERLEREVNNLESTQEIPPEEKYFIDTKAAKLIALLEDVNKSTDIIKAEAVKEFAERLKRTDLALCGTVIWDDFIDNLVKEMVGED